jgi:hypothetical protein
MAVRSSNPLNLLLAPQLCGVPLPFAMPGRVRISLVAMELVIAIVANLVIGVLLLALFAWYRTPDAVRISGPAEALTIFRGHFPEAAGMVTVASDGLAALIALQQGSGFGLVHRHGRRWNVRAVQSEDLHSVMADNETITLSLADFGWPRTRIRIVDQDARGAWLSRLHALAEEGSNTHSVAPHA